MEEQRTVEGVIEIPINKLTPHPKNNKLLPTLTPKELMRLKERIQEFGFTEAIEITEDFYILDGHHRIQILKEYYEELKIDTVPCRIIPVSEEDQADYILSKNFDRRQLSPLMQSYIRGKDYNTAKKKLGANQYTMSKNDPGSGNDQSLGKMKTSKILAQKYDVSASTIEKDGRFVKKCNELILLTSYEFVFDLLNGKIPAQKNSILLLTTLPEDDVEKIYHYYTTESTPPHKSIGYVLYLHGLKKKSGTAKRQVIFKVDREKLNRLYNKAFSQGKSKDDLLDEMIDYYFTSHP